MRFLKSTLAKKILGTVLIIGCSGIFLNGHVGISEPVHAQVQGLTGSVNSTGTSMNTMDVRGFLNMVLKIIYLLLRPLLVVAGLALDNTLVYASIFHLDAPLRKFRNMMKNFANFALGFMVLFAIIKSILTNSGEGSAKDEKTPLGIIKVTLIAGVLIQASRFLMAATVDISTIATYAIGGLPLSVLKNTAIGDQRILSVNSSIDFDKFNILNKQGEGFRIRYSTTYKGKNINISTCRVKEQGGKTYVIGREFGENDYNNFENFKGTDYAGYEVCVVSLNKLVMRQESGFMNAIQQLPNFTTGDYTAPGGYKKMMDGLLGYTGWETTAPVTTYLVNLDSGSTQVYKDGFAKGSGFFEASSAMTISSLINKSKGFVGPLVTIYSSLLNFAQLTDANVTTIGETSGIFIIKSLVAIALFFPLIALALVLIARIGMLRLYIVASPFIILKASFKNFIKIKGLDDYLSIESVGGIIFAPVITVAALSISLIFMTALVNGFNSPGSSDQIHQSLGAQTITPIQTGNDAFNFGGIASVEFTKLPRGEAGDRFSRLIINLFAIGLMRMVFFAAIKANKLGEKIGGGVQSFGQNLLQTLPIIPFNEGKERVGIGSLAKVASQAPETWVENRKREQNNEVMEKRFSPPSATTTINSETATKLATSLGGGTKTEEAVKAAGITAPLTNLGTQENMTAMYNAINLLKEPDQQKQAISGAATIFNDEKWFENEKIRPKKEALEGVIKITSKDTDTKTIDDLISKNTKIVDEYFATGATEYTKTIEGTTFTIKQDPADKTKYIVSTKK